MLRDCNLLRIGQTKLLSISGNSDSVCVLSLTNIYVADAWNVTCWDLHCPKCERNCEMLGALSVVCRNGEYPRRPRTAPMFQSNKSFLLSLLVLGGFVGTFFTYLFGPLIGIPCGIVAGLMFSNWTARLSKEKR
jgi:hypothetical protein